MSDVPPEIPSYAWPALWSMVVGFFMILVDSTIVSVATPSLMAAFYADVNAVLWVTSGYLLGYAVPLLITGRLGDRYGPKRLYLVGLTVFTLSSLACGLTGSLPGLVAARVVQGLGASMMTPQTMAVITRTFPAARRGQAMALWGSVAGIATLVGPLLGGVLLDALDWRWIFFVNVPVGVIAFALAWRFVPHLETHAHSLDLVGVGLSAVGLFCVVLGLQEGETHGWGQVWGPVSVPLLIGVGAACLLVFVWWQSRVKPEPLVPLELFRDRNFSVANLGIASVGFAVTAFVFPFMIYAQTVRGWTPTQAALLTAPQSVAGFLLARLVGRLVDGTHPRLIAGGGLAGLAASMLATSWAMRPDTPVWVLLLTSTGIGVSSAFVWGPLSTSANRNLNPRMAGAGAGVYNAVRQMGSVVGSAAIAAAMAWTVARRPGDLAGALAEAMLLPAAAVTAGFVVVLFFERPHHLRGERR